VLHEEISGVPKAAQGRVESSQETGKLFNLKREQGEVMLRYMFDNLDTMSLQLGQNSLDLIQKYMTEEEQIRVLDDKDNPYWLTINERTVHGISNNPTIGKYDVQISQTPYGATSREIAYMKVLDFAKFVGEIFPQAVPVLLPIVAKASDSPYRNDIMLALEKIVGITDLQMQQAMLAKFIEQQRAITEGRMQEQQNSLNAESAKYQIDKAKQEDTLYQATESILGGMENFN
jgi:hypothetical protein